MSSIHYCAAWTECGCFVSCGHSHTSVQEAVACISSAGSYVVAIDTGTMRSLNRTEEAEFQIAICNYLPVKPAEGALAVAACTAIDSRYAVMTRIRVGDQWARTTWMCFPSQAEASAHAREGDKVVRFRSAEWQELRQDTTVSGPKHVCADSDPSRTGQDETLIETALRLLRTAEYNLGLGSLPEKEPINSEGKQQDENQHRKRA